MKKAPPPPRPTRKRCPRCGESKPLAAFAPDRSSADGRFTYCKPCKRAGERERRRTPVAVKRGRASMPRLPPPGPEVPSASTATPGKNLGGRPTSLTADVIAAVVDVLERGHTRRAAAAMAGVTDRALRRWLANAQEDDATPLELELLQEVEHAEGVGEHTLVELVRKSAAIDPNAAKWLLERRHSQDWARKESLSVTSGDKPADLGALRERISLKINALIAARAEPTADAPATEAAPPAPGPEA